MAHAQDTVMQPTDATALSSTELARYHRHLILPGVGLEGQEKLKGARVLLVGAGGLGSPAALYLAAAGVGTIGVIDDDVVDVTNLQRQILHSTQFVGRPKVDSARERMSQLNPHVRVDALQLRLTRENILRVIADYDIVLDGTDNFDTRYLINDACVSLGKHNVYGAVIRFDGQASVFSAGGPCYRCLFPEPPEPGTVPNCAEGGVFGVLPGLVGTIQATEAIKLITGVGDTLRGRLLLVDALRMRFQSIAVERDPACATCGTREFPALNGSEGVVCATDEIDESADEMTPMQLDARIRSGVPLVVIDVREPYEWAIARIPQARLIPLNSLPNVVNTLDAGAETVVYCHHGMRSEAAVSWLRDHGFARAINLAGGIDRWSLEVDAQVRRY